MPIDIERDFESRATLADDEATIAIRRACERHATEHPDEAVSYLRDAIASIHKAEGWRRAAQAVADRRVKT